MDIHDTVTRNGLENKHDNYTYIKAMLELFVLLSIIHNFGHD